jgi:hypothetical protein
MVGIAAHDVEQLAFSRRLEVGDRAFEQMAGAVEQRRPGWMRWYQLER